LLWQEALGQMLFAVSIVQVREWNIGRDVKIGEPRACGGLAQIYKQRLASLSVLRHCLLAWNVVGMSAEELPGTVPHNLQMLEEDGMDAAQPGHPKLKRDHVCVVGIKSLHEVCLRGSIFGRDILPGGVLDR